MSRSTNEPITLAQSEARYRRILETAAEGVWVLDAANRTTFANGRMGDLLDCRPDEMLGRDAFGVFADEQAEIARRRLDEQRAGRRTEADHHLLSAGGVMPAMSGADLAERIGALHPHTGSS